MRLDLLELEWLYRPKKGLWYGATEGLWVREEQALRGFEQRFPDCRCCPPSYLLPHMVPIRITDPWQAPYHNTNPVEVRYCWQWRDGFGRFAGGLNDYVWRPDFDAFVGWYERHLASLSAELLNGTESF